MSLRKNIMRMGKPRTSFTRSAALLAIGAAVGAGVAMMRSPKQRPRQTIDDGIGPVETDL